MARPLKDNADWYAHQAQMRNNRKVRVLRARFGSDGYATWCMLLECLTEADGFFLGWTPLDRELIAGDFALTLERLEEIVSCCEKIGMLTIRNGTLFSENLQNSMKPLLDIRERKRQWKEAKTKVVDGKNRVKDGENPHSTDTDTDTDTVHNTLSGISSKKPEPDFEIKKTRVDTLPEAIAAAQQWYTTPEGKMQIEALRAAAMYAPEKYQDGSIAHQIAGFFAHYWKTDAYQAQIKQDPIAYTIQNFCAWLANAKRMNKPATDQQGKPIAPQAGPSPKPRSQEQDYHFTEDQIRQYIKQHAPLYQTRFTENNIHTLRQKASPRGVLESIGFICKTLAPDDFAPSTPAFQQQLATA